MTIRSDWRDYAACNDMSVVVGSYDMFFGENPDNTLCKVCPARLECLDYAMAEHITDGMWGGLDPLRRQRLKRKRQVYFHPFIDNIVPAIEDVVNSWDEQVETPV